MKRSVLCFCAHNDDQVIGAGGTLAKYASEGRDVYVVIFSYGEKSHPHMKREFMVPMRVKESHKAKRILGFKKETYLGLSEGRLIGEVKEKKLGIRLQRMIKELSPGIIFTHSVDDPHPDHRAVHSIVLGLLDDIRYKGSLYSFDVWNPVNIMKRNIPKLVVDISATFGRKILAMRQHESQKFARFSLWWNLYLKAYLNGLNYGFKYAEVFYKIR